MIGPWWWKIVPVWLDRMLGLTLRWSGGKVER